MMTPGEYLLDVDAGPVEANAGRRTARVVVKNAGDRPIQAGSHFHFFETNVSLLFDHVVACGSYTGLTALWRALLTITGHALERSTARGRPAFLLTVKGIGNEPSD